MKILTTLFVALFASGLAATDADAARLGGGRSIGMQRQGIQQARPVAPAQAPSTAPAAPAQPAPSGASRWLGPLAGLAMGAGLAALFMHNGATGALAGIMMLLAIVAAALLVMRMMRSKMTPAPQYAGSGAQDTTARFEPLFGSGAASAPASATHPFPPDFDAEQFVHHAKLNFVRLQAAHDARDLATLRDVTTPELYAALEADVKSATAPQKTDVVTLEAEVLDVAAESGRYVVSVKFSGLIREAEGGQPEAFAELWHLEKPSSGKRGWLVAGIQQT